LAPTPGRGALPPPYPAHYLLHGAGKYGLQCLANLDRLPPTGAMLIAPPLKIKGGTGSPLRVLALVTRSGPDTTWIPPSSPGPTRESARIWPGLLERDYTVVNDLPQRLRESRHRFVNLECDLLDAVAGRQAAAAIAADHHVTHLVHNAGLIWPNLVEEAKPADITGLSQLHLGVGADPGAGVPADDEGAAVSDG
jgi:hypothetical protein